MPLTASRIKPRLPPKAMYFDGTDDYVDVYPFDIITDFPFTVEAMVSADTYAQSYSGIVDHGRSAKKNFWILTHADYEKIQVGVGDGSGGQEISIDVSSYLGEPILVTAVFYNDLIRGYLNGVYVAGRTLTITPVIDTSIRLTLGMRTSHTYGFRGYIAFVRIYNRSLSESEIEWNYLHPSDPVRDGLVLWLHWDSIDSASGLWKDKTYHGNDGTIYGASEIEFTPPPYRKLTPVRKLNVVR